MCLGITWKSCSNADSDSGRCQCCSFHSTRWIARIQSVCFLSPEDRIFRAWHTVGPELIATELTNLKSNRNFTIQQFHFKIQTVLVNNYLRRTLLTSFPPSVTLYSHLFFVSLLQSSLASGTSPTILNLIFYSFYTLESTLEEFSFSLLKMKSRGSQGEEKWTPVLFFRHQLSYYLLSPNLTSLEPIDYQRIPHTSLDSTLVLSCSESYCLDVLQKWKWTIC